MISIQKVINFNKPLNEICKDDPEISNIMRDLGFNDIANPMMLSTVGRFMTIEKGSKAKGIDISIIQEAFIKRGYTIEGEK